MKMKLKLDEEDDGEAHEYSDDRFDEDEIGA